MASGKDTKIHVISVLPDYGYSVVAQYFAEDAQEKAKVETLARLRDFVAKFGDGDRIGQVTVEHGKIYEEILETAKGCKADLIVIASRSEERVGPFLMGSNAEKVVRYSPCSVLVMKS
jgi:nucleotide-binding universal stress UspA family protein